jgi:Tfp pilus assembly protein PilV
MRRIVSGRRGFTLVETLVALVLFQVGMFALVATAAVSARDLAEAVARRRAQVIASSHAELLRADACRSAPAGSAALTAGMVERWRVDVVGVGRAVTVTVDVPLPRGRSVEVAASAWSVCSP